MFLRKTYFRLIKNARNCYTTVQNKAVKENAVARQIYTRIRGTGPITVADYMKEVLLNPAGGYYMHKDVFGEDGDFITSPELSQIFGEMVAVWLLNEWSKAGSPKPVQIVELGPGKGSLCQDVLRVFDHFQALQGTSVHLVEISPHLSDLQARRLCLQSQPVFDKLGSLYKEGVSHQGVPVKWYRNLYDVPGGFTLFVAHEFFDALPVHKFQKTKDGYREILVDVDPEKELCFRYIIARDGTPIQKVLIKENQETRDHLEISPESLIVAKDLSQRLNEFGGIALIADYGHNGTGTDTFRAFRKHKLHDPLVEPGTADLTADVDFSRIKEAAEEGGNVICFGPVNQRDFLLEVGIEHRFKMLCENMKDENHLKGLKFSYEMMLDEDKMGKRFKLISLFPSVLKKILDKFPPVGFKTAPRA